MSRVGIKTVDALTPKVFVGLIVGAMLPYWFSAMTMKSVGSTALKMVEEVLGQFSTMPGLMDGRTNPDYATCVKISTDASLKEMIPPGALVMVTPLVAGTFFGVESLAGVLAGSLVSAVQVHNKSQNCISHFVPTHLSIAYLLLAVCNGWHNHQTVIHVLCETFFIPL